jgi:hypothetical protein
MLTELILIGVSVIVLLFLVSMRYFSLSYAKGNSNFLYKSDLKINFIWVRIKKFYRETSMDITDLFKDIPHLVLHFLNRVFYKLYKKTKKLVDLIKGNKVPTDRGSVSIYLKNIEKEDSENRSI